MESLDPKTKKELEKIEKSVYDKELNLRNRVQKPEHLHLLKLLRISDLEKLNLAENALTITMMLPLYSVNFTKLKDLVLRDNELENLEFMGRVDFPDLVLLDLCTFSLSQAPIE